MNENEELYVSRYYGEEIDNGIEGGLNAIQTDAIVQVTGQGTTEIMSQKAVTDAIAAAILSITDGNEVSY